VQGPFNVKHLGVFEPEGEEGVRRAAEADMDGPQQGKHHILLKC